MIAATLACGYVELFPKAGISLHIRDAITFWSELHTKRRLLRTPAASLIGLSIAGLLLWAIFAAPAIYSGAEGKSTFEHELREFNHGRDAFLADFVVTATSLGTQLTGNKNLKSYAAGDYYCCLGTQDGCKRMALLQERRVIAFNDGEHFRSAVLASGAPFPIYPARRVDRDDEHAGMFIDGGYTHDTPIEAAQVLGAEEVLIVHSAQRVDPAHKTRHSFADRRVGALAYDAAGLFPFLFDRSQAVDNEVRERMFVASLAPSSQRGRDPVFLMDFRDSTIRDLDHLAAIDFARHRIGQIESWGLPRRLLHDTRFDDCPKQVRTKGGSV